MEVLARRFQLLAPELRHELLSDQTKVEASKQKKGGFDGFTHVFWATDDYRRLGDDYDFHAPILDRQVYTEHGPVLQPRCEKQRAAQDARVRDRGEVFSPAWLCNQQNNLIDDRWFGRPHVFNVEQSVGEGSHGWIATVEPISFPEGKTWRDYVQDLRLEVACGEAPYLVSRYDVSSGVSIDVPQRIGFLDRKLRVVGENTSTPEEWFAATCEAYKSVYGYEWQGDNLLLARLNLFFTLFEYYHFKFGVDAPPLSLEQQLTIANIISWNLWQMDGLKGVIPDTCKGSEPIGLDLFGEVSENTSGCRGCQTGDIREHNGMYCKIKDWHYVPKRRKAKTDASVGVEAEGAQDPWRRGTEKVIRFIDMIGQ